MKNLLTKKRGINKKTKVIFITIVSIIVLCGLITAFKAVNSWFEHNYFVFTQPVEVKLNQPISVKERKPITQKVVLDYPGEIDTPIKQYICDKFGVWNCKTALAIVEAESNFNDQAMHVNTNGSVDLGCWQINFPTHLKTITPADALDCKKATDWAFEKYTRDGNFNAWVTFTNGAYLVKL
jgi:hypothetical protein